MVVLGGEVVSYERGTPVEDLIPSVEQRRPFLYFVARLFAARVHVQRVALAKSANVQRSWIHAASQRICTTKPGDQRNVMKLYPQQGN